MQIELSYEDFELLYTAIQTEIESMGDVTDEYPPYSHARDLQFRLLNAYGEQVKKELENASD